MSPNPLVTVTAKIENRREIRRPGQGSALVRWSNPRPQQVEGQLVDVSDSGFRMAHGCAALTAGQEVEFSHPEAKGRVHAWIGIIVGDCSVCFI